MSTEGKHFLSRQLPTRPVSFKTDSIWLQKKKNTHFLKSYTTRYSHLETLDRLCCMFLISQFRTHGQKWTAVVFAYVFHRCCPLYTSLPSERSCVLSDPYDNSPNTNRALLFNTSWKHIGCIQKKRGEKKTDGSLEEVKERLCTLYGNTETSKHSHYSYS